MGIRVQKDLAKHLVPAVRLLMEEEGTLTLASPVELADLRDDYELLVAAGCVDIEWWDARRVAQQHGLGEHHGFVAGIFFPHDARIDGLTYAQRLVEESVRHNPRASVIDYSPSVVDVVDGAEHATVVFADGTHIFAKHVVLATNGLFVPRPLAGLLVPCWTYFVALPHPVDPLTGRAVVEPAAAVAPQLCMGGYSSPNFVTQGIGADWCVTQGMCRVSGEDRFSALKPPRAFARCHALAAWTLQRYPYMAKLLGAASPAPEDILPEHLAGRFVYGVYAETPDYLPIVGPLTADSRVFYMVGCNAVGQAPFSFAASVVPGMLGLAPLSPKKQELAGVMAAARFSPLASTSELPDPDAKCPFTKSKL
jgi:glycine/D-amino acid oxidase-like deaminating enzyme